ncbi:MAG: FeoB-associated Cys-rich membrane protein [Muribaculaceae bacterium]|nr:FeoB-associated Cys-rich membrane protein [Muribaculaceae bacterium]
MDWQTITVAAIVTAAVALAARRVWRAMHGHSDCGCGCGDNCPHRNTCPHNQPNN